MRYNEISYPPSTDGTPSPGSLLPGVAVTHGNENGHGLPTANTLQSPSIQPLLNPHDASNNDQQITFSHTVSPTQPSRLPLPQCLSYEQGGETIAACVATGLTTGLSDELHNEVVQGLLQAPSGSWSSSGDQLRCSDVDVSEGSHPGKRDVVLHLTTTCFGSKLITALEIEDERGRGIRVPVHPTPLTLPALRSPVYLPQDLMSKDKRLLPALEGGVYTHCKTVADSDGHVRSLSFRKDDLNVELALRTTFDNGYQISHADLVSSYDLGVTMEAEKWLQEQEAKLLGANGHALAGILRNSLAYAQGLSWNDQHRPVFRTAATFGWQQARLELDAAFRPDGLGGWDLATLTMSLNQIWSSIERVPDDKPVPKAVDRVGSLRSRYSVAMVDLPKRLKSQVRQKQFSDIDQKTTQARIAAGKGDSSHFVVGILDACELVRRPEDYDRNMFVKQFKIEYDNKEMTILLQFEDGTYTHVIDLQRIRAGTSLVPFRTPSKDGPKYSSYRRTEDLYKSVVRCNQFKAGDLQAHWHAENTYRYEWNILDDVAAACALLDPNKRDPEATAPKPLSDGSPARMHVLIDALNVYGYALSFYGKDIFIIMQFSTKERRVYVNIQRALHDGHAQAILESIQAAQSSGSM